MHGWAHHVPTSVLADAEAVDKIWHHGVGSNLHLAGDTACGGPPHRSGATEEGLGEDFGA
jgi:hypothetical protein